MGIKKSFQKTLQDPVVRRELLYYGAKITCIILAFAFFLSYFFTSAQYKSDIFLPLIFPLYISFVVSIALYISSALLYFWYKKIPLPVQILWIILSIGVSGVLLFPLW